MKIERLKDYENEYLIDELGNIVSIPKISNPNQFSNYYVIRGKISKNGYVTVTLTKNSIHKNHLLHRLVAKQFIENAENKPQVNHIDGVKTNNKVSNLEWATAKENKQHAIRFNISNSRNIAIENLKKHNDKNKYVYIEVEKDGIINKFNSTNEACGFIGCCKDRVSYSIKNKCLIKGFVVRGHKAQSANEET